MRIFTYLLRSLKDNSYYTGITNNPYRRLEEHNNGKLKITSFKKPFKLVYFKRYGDYVEARKHEKWLKKKNRNYKKKLENIFIS